MYTMNLRVMLLSCKDFTKSTAHLKILQTAVSLQWRHNGRDGVSNHQPHDCLLNHLFRRRSKKTWKLRVTGLCVGNSPVTGEFPAQMASNAENVSIWWRHHVLFLFELKYCTSYEQKFCPTLLNQHKLSFWLSHIYFESENPEALDLRLHDLLSGYTTIVW